MTVRPRAVLGVTVRPRAVPGRDGAAPSGSGRDGAAPSGPRSDGAARAVPGVTVRPRAVLGVTVRRRGDDGFAGGFEGLLFGMLLFVGGTLLVAFAWAVVDTKSATVEAARQAARSYVLAPDPLSAAASAQQAADAALSGYGRDPSRAKVGVTAGEFERCGRITITISYPAPLFYLPFVGSVGTGDWVKSDNSELVDPFRSGLAGVAQCADG